MNVSRHRCHGFCALLAALLAAPLASQAAPMDDVLKQVDINRVQQHVQMLAGKIGVRCSNTPKDTTAAVYMADQFIKCGYPVSLTWVKLPDRRNINVYAELPGTNPKVVLMGGHLDTKALSPGANDDASGVAMTLELARAFKVSKAKPPYTLGFAGFTAEEIYVGMGSNDHHFGSRAMAANAAFRSRLYSMTSLDMVGVGTDINFKTNASNSWRTYLNDSARKMRLPAHVYSGVTGSDHEPFEALGTPACQIDWTPDDQYHTKNDTPSRMQAKPLRLTAELMIRAVFGLNPSGIVKPVQPPTPAKTLNPNRPPDD